MDIDYDDDGNPKIKIILVGEAKVGKTQLINVMNPEEKFDPDYLATLDSTFLKREIQIDEHIINTYLWDTMGGEDTRSIVDIFFKGAKIVIFVYSITDKRSFVELDNYWVNLVKEKLGNDIILGLVGNKKDLYKKKVVTDQEGKSYASKIKAKWSLTSAKDERPEFQKYIFGLIKDYVKKVDLKNKSKSGQKGTTKLNQNQGKTKGKKCC